MKSEITFEDYLTLRGLLALALDKYNFAVKDCNTLMASIVGVEEEGGESEYPYYGHVTDAIYSNYTADTMLKKLGIKVLPRSKKKKIA